MEFYRQTIFPFAQIPYGSSIVIYGAGDIGQTFYHQVTACGFCKVVGWLDRCWAELANLPHPLMTLDDLSTVSFDYVVIAISNPSVCNDVAAVLKGKGVRSDKIVSASDSQIEFNLCHPADAPEDSSGHAESPEVSFVHLLCGATDIALPQHPFVAEDAQRCHAQRIWNMAIVGTGFMAEIMASCVKRRLGNVRLHAVVSRDMGRARAFADRFGVPCAYDSCEALASDGLVELVHIATPVFLHHTQSLLFLRSGKHVLCEKPFALNERQAREMFAVAAEHNRVLVDGVWPRYLPLASKLQQILESGIIGKVCTLTGNLYYAAASTRLGDMHMGGGISLESGTYLMALASLVLGRNVRRVSATGLLDGGGTDRQSSITLLYDDALAVFACGMDGVSDRQACIYGEKGFVVVDNANEYKVINVFDAGGRPIERHAMQSGYEFEVRACLDAMERNAQGLKTVETPCYRQEETLFAMRMLDEARRQMGVCYAEDVPAGQV